MGLWVLKCLKKAAKKAKHNIPLRPGLAVQQLKEKSSPAAQGSSSSPPADAQPVEQGVSGPNVSFGNQSWVPRCCWNSLC